MIVTGKVDFADLINRKIITVKQLIHKNRFLEKLFLFRAFPVDHPAVTPVIVGEDIRVIKLHQAQLADHIRIHIMTEYQLTFGVVYPRAVGGDHKRVNSQCITDLRHIHMMAAGGKNKMHAFIDGQQAEGFLGVGGQTVGR